MRFPALTAALLLTACAGTEQTTGYTVQDADEAIRSGGAPEGGLRLTRVTDPTLACTVVAASELGGARLGTGRTQTREGRVMVTWRNVDTGQGRKRIVTCAVDTAAGAVVSLRTDGVEQLEAPQPI